MKIKGDNVEIKQLLDSEIKFSVYYVPGVLS